MPYELSFTEDFFGDPYAEQEKSRRPTDVCQALFSMPRRRWNRMCRDVFGCKPEYVDLDTVLLKIFETNTCSGGSSPVGVWIDDEGYYTVDVFDWKDDEDFAQCDF